MPTAAGRILWEPDARARDTSNVAQFLRWLTVRRGLEFPDYESAWHWSVTEPEEFWTCVWDYFEVGEPGDFGRVLSSRSIAGARWFEGAKLNYAERALGRRGEGLAIVAGSESRPPMTLTRDELASAVASAAAGLRRLGVGAGDHVAALLPNIPEAVIGLLASASIGAVWSSCAPEFGARSVVDRFRQIRPAALLAVDGYVYAGHRHKLTDTLAQLRSDLPSLRASVIVPYLEPDVGPPDGMLGWAESMQRPAPRPVFEPVDFSHPLWVLYSSGTTGPPKAIVQGHGGILIEHLKTASFCLDLGSSDRLFWYTSTGWMMWNFLISGLLVGGSIALYDGSPSHPDMTELWRFASEEGVTYFGTSASFIHACMRRGLKPRTEVDLSNLRGIGSTGSPLSPEGFEWVYGSVGDRLMLNSFSGGTDICTGIVGASPLVPIRAGEISCRILGAPVAAFDQSGRSIVDEVGELVLTGPMPSMPLGLVGDDDGSLFRESYLTPYQDVWRQGDFIRITPHGSCVIQGRSDSTLNRGGIRTGTADYYRVVEDMEEVVDSLVVDVGGIGGDGRLVLMVVLRGGEQLDKGLRLRINRKIRSEISPRHVPDEIHSIGAVPRTLNGKKMEVPAKRILEGEPIENVASRDAMSNPDSLSEIALLAGH